MKNFQDFTILDPSMVKWVTCLPGALLILVQSLVKAIHSDSDNHCRVSLAVRRVLGSVPTAADWFIWDNIIGQDAYLDCASPYPGVMGT